MRAFLKNIFTGSGIFPGLNLQRFLGAAFQLFVLAGLTLLSAGCFSTESALYVSPEGDDQAVGTLQAPFRTLHRAQAAARGLTAGMQGDVVVHVAPGDYRLDRPLIFTEADSGSNGFQVVYQSAAGPGQARLLGSRVLTGWQPYRDGIWKVALPANSLFHTLYENGRRVHKARFPDYEYNPEMPVALGRYLTTEDGTPKRSDKNVTQTNDPGWLVYRPEDAPPVTDVTKMRIHIFPGGRCDWVREVHTVTSIDPATRRLTFAKDPPHGVGADARFFLEDELGFLNAPGEFFVDEKAQTLYYIPLGKGHPDTLGIACPTLSRLIQLKGRSIDECVENLVLDGLFLGETDNSPPQPYWAYQGLNDGALIWMNNAAGIEIRNCHLKNGGRSGVMMIGHNVGNRVTGCWIEHMGLNGVSLCNKFLAPGGKERTPGRCEHNRIDNTRISHVGELHTYAECVTIFNASSNEVDHCQLDNSVRYAITVRGNTGAQYGPPVSTAHPPAVGNRFHHISISRCGQDGGDMGALHCAMLNNPGGGCVNSFEQITVADTRAIDSVQDHAPNGIFLDWPKMSMDQIFRNIHIIRSQGEPIRSNGPDNEESMQRENVSWQPGFSEERMDYAQIGLTAAFPAAFGGAPERRAKPVKVQHLRGGALAHNRVVLEWDAAAEGANVEYVIVCDGREVGRSREPQWVAESLKELTAYRFGVAARSGDFSHSGPFSECRVTTPADKEPPLLSFAHLAPRTRSVHVTFSEPVDPASVTGAAQFTFVPELTVSAVSQISSDRVQLRIDGCRTNVAYTLCVEGVTDCAAARNRMTGEQSMAVDCFDVTVAYAPGVAGAERLVDGSGGGGDAILRGGASLVAGLGPHGGTALVLDGKQGYAEAPADLNLGPGDFTFALWVYPEGGGVVVSKGTNFGAPGQWSFGCGELRSNNHYFNAAPGAVKYRRWTHLAFVRRGNTGLWYVNGQPSGDTHDLRVIGSLVNDRLLRIGRREYEANPTYFKGRLSSLTILPWALTPEQIRSEAIRK